MLGDREIADLEAHVAADPANHGARYRLAEALLGAGHPAGALVHARILLSITPRDAAVLGLAAMSADMNGDHDVALQFEATLRSVQSGEDGAPLGRRVMHRGAQHPSMPREASISLLTLRDVMGMSEARRRLEQTLVKRWSDATTKGTPVADGVLLYGPQSSGKRFLVHAAAGECALPVIELDMAEVVDPWGDPGPSRLLAAFEAAEHMGPSVLLLANVEIATHRRLRYTASGRKVLTDLLSALDRRNSARVFVVATSAAPWLVQPTLRSGRRFVESVLVGPPDQGARRHLIEQTLRARNVAHDFDLDALAVALEGCSTTDIDTVIHTAMARAYADSTTLGRVTSVRAGHIDAALLSAPKSAHAWFDTAYNFPEFTDDSSQFDPLFDYIRRHVRRG